MPDASDPAAEPAGEPPEESGSGQAGESLRAAVERTLESTAGSAGELLDEVSRLGVAAREGVARRGGEAREEVVRRSDAAREAVRRRREEARHEVLRRREAARDEVSRRSDAARDDLSRRAEEAGGLLADAVAQLRPAERLEGEDLGILSAQIEALERRLSSLERLLRGESAESEPQVEAEDSPGEAAPGAESGD